MNPKKQCFVKKGVRVGSKGSCQKKSGWGGSGRSASPRNTDPGVRVGNKGSGQKIKAGGGVQGGGVTVGNKGSGQKKKSGWGGGRSASPRNTDPGVRVGNKGSGQTIRNPKMLRWTQRNDASEKKGVRVGNQGSCHRIKAGGGVQGGGRSASPRSACPARST